MSSRTGKFVVRAEIEYVRKQVVCPRCGSLDTVPIVYGYPMAEAEAEARAGKIALGGCIVMPDQPTRY